MREAPTAAAPALPAAAVATPGSAPLAERPSPQICTFEHELRELAATNPVVHHVGLFLTIGDAVLTIVGLAYSYLFYRHFGINVADRAIFLALIPLILVSYAFLFSRSDAQASAARLRHGGGKMVRVVRTTAAPSDSARKVLVGTTAKFFFFYDTLKQTTDIVPVGNVAAVTVDLPARAQTKR